MPTKLTLTHVGRDNWDRPIYTCEGKFYVDVDPRSHRPPEICTKDHFYDEPRSDIPAGTEVEFIPRRDTWY